MFWRKKKSSGPPIVGCFGKLPATGDFIRHRASGAELESFDRWLGGAIDHAQRALGPGFEAAYQRAFGMFVYRPEAQGNEEPARALVGAWAASGDSAGRLYPMVVFASCDYGQLCALGGALPVALWRFFAEAHELATRGRSWPVDTFLDKVARLEAPNLDEPERLAAGYTQWLEQHAMTALWETGFGVDASRFWVMSNVIESVAPFKGQELPSTGLAMRLPVGAGDAYLAAFWIDLVLRLGGWKGTLVNTLWTPQQTVLLHLGAPLPGSLREILAPTGQSDHVAELCGLPTCDERAARARLRPEHDAIVARTDQPIGRFLAGF
jgi:type VI secretion system protein ImpM